MGKLEKVNAQILNNRYYMSFVSIIMFSVFGYIFSNYDKISNILIGTASFLILSLAVEFVRLAIKNKKLIDKLEEL